VRLSTRYYRTLTAVFLSLSSLQALPHFSCCQAIQSSGLATFTTTTRETIRLSCTPSLPFHHLYIRTLPALKKASVFLFAVYLSHCLRVWIVLFFFLIRTPPPSSDAKYKPRLLWNSTPSSTPLTSQLWNHLVTTTHHQHFCTRTHLLTSPEYPCKSQIG
jgi:hypothetical protein